MTPAEEMRAAVAVLRCEHSFTVFSAENTRVPCEHCGIPYKRLRDMIQPDLAELLASVLDGAAAAVEEGAPCPPSVLQLVRAINERVHRPGSHSAPWEVAHAAAE